MLFGVVLLFCGFLKKKMAVKLIVRPKRRHPSYLDVTVITLINFLESSVHMSKSNLDESPS